jgi:hypothetical protein
MLKHWLIYSRIIFYFEIFFQLLTTCKMFDAFLTRLASPGCGALFNCTPKGVVAAIY